MSLEILHIGDTHTYTHTHTHIHTYISLINTSSTATTTTNQYTNPLTQQIDSELFKTYQISLNLEHLKQPHPPTKE